MKLKLSHIWSYCGFKVFLKLLQEVGHGWVVFKIIEVVVDPQQHYSGYLWERKTALLKGARGQTEFLEKYSSTFYVFDVVKLFSVRAALRRSSLSSPEVFYKAKWEVSF